MTSSVACNGHRAHAGTLLLALLAPLGACAAEDQATHISEALRHDLAVSIDIESLRAAGDASFAALDADGDGMITETEFGASQDHRGMGFAHHGDGFLFVQGDGAEVEIPDVEIPDIDVEVLAGEEHLVVAHDGQRIVRMFVGRDDETAFGEMDADGDGMLSLEEYENRPERMPIPRQEIEIEIEDSARAAFQGFDANDDGVITRDEWPSPENRLAALDTDGDGTISFSELAGERHRRVVIDRNVIVTP